MAMSGYDAATYGQRIAEVYDEWYPEVEPAALDTLEALGRGGPALGLGIGGGRVARPQVSRGEEDPVMFGVSLHDPLTQVVTSQHVLLTGDGPRLYPVKIRYAWPGELDLMARLAGLRLRERWGGWDRSSFTAASTRH